MPNENPTIQELECKPQDKSKGKDNIFECSLKIGTEGGKHIHEPAKLLLQGKYFRERSPLHKFLDIGSILTVMATIVLLGYFIWPKSTPDYISVDASVAPKEVVTGGSSTLTFRYENQSRETLRHVKVTFEFPKHFKLTSIESETGEQISEQSFELGDITPTQYGFLHVRGTMFGDVGGEQTFSTTFEYDYGDNKHDTKTLTHTFSPTASTLALELKLPDHLVAHQEVKGSIVYSNQGDIDFPDLTIEPVWPKGFTLLSSSPSLQSGVWRLTPIKSSESGEIIFTGRLGTVEDTNFEFNPSFAFGDERYGQEKLVDQIEILPPPLKLTQSIDEKTLKPGSRVNIKLDFENVSDYEISDITLRLTSDSPILSSSNIIGGSYNRGYYIFDDKIEKLAPGETGSATISIPIKTTLSSTSAPTQNIKVKLQSSALFSFRLDEELVEANTGTESFEIPLTSPVVLQSFGRYWTASGDQIGRGPMPPVVGETTKYWIFWNIAGTTNRIDNIMIEAPLGPGVSFTGKQSVSVGSPVTASNGSIRWSVKSIDATLPTNNVVVGAAFEVAVTPDATQVGTTPILLKNAVITGTDSFTGEIVTGSATAVTTKLINDSQALQYGGIVEE